MEFEGGSRWRRRKSVEQPSLIRVDLSKSKAGIQAMRAVHDALERLVSEIYESERNARRTESQNTISS